MSEALSTFFTKLKSILSEIIRVPGARRILGFTGIAIVILLLAFWAIGQRFGSVPTAIPNATTALGTAHVVDTDIAQETPISIETPPLPTEVLPPSSSMPGGVDKIAFIANGDIWLMNVDGSQLQLLTTDGGVKSDLQWLPDGETITFISGLIIKYVNISTHEVYTLTSFPTASSLDAFHVSHDGKQVMISLNKEIFVVPFDFERMKNVHKKSDLLMLNGCMLPEPKTKSGLAVREALWSADDQLVAWLFKGVDPTRNPKLQFEQISVMDIKKCIPAEIDQLDNFPAQRFKAEDGEPVQYNDDGLVPDVDWDGNDLFVFNTDRQNGWGELYVYNWRTKKPFHSNQIDGVCCYRDARWSPDGLYLLFAFQDQRLGAAAPTRLYYVLYREGVGTQSPFLPLPEGFFKNRKEAPQPALRPAP